jgi:hypothetical protein
MITDLIYLEQRIERLEEKLHALEKIYIPQNIKLYKQE